MALTSRLCKLFEQGRSWTLDNVIRLMLIVSAVMSHDGIESGGSGSSTPDSKVAHSVLIHRAFAKYSLGGESIFRKGRNKEGQVVDASFFNGCLILWIGLVHPSDQCYQADIFRSIN